jgi:dystrophin
LFQDDIVTLEPNVDNINRMGEQILSLPHQPDSDYPAQFRAELAALNHNWAATVGAARAQNAKLLRARDKSREIMELLTEINTFLDQLEQELPAEGAVVTQAPELSQRTYRLLQLRDKTDRKSSVMDRLSTTVAELLEAEKQKEIEKAGAESSSSSSGTGARCAALSSRLQQLQARWSSLTEPVSQQYVRMKEATSDYGEFKTLVAQESDWLDRLEKKLRRSSKCAADAEEISEELDDLENCLHNHPEERIPRLRILADGLSEKDVLISPVQTEAERLAKRWKNLERQTRERIRSLEGNPCDKKRSIVYAVGLFMKLTLTLRSLSY